MATVRYKRSERKKASGLSEAKKPRFDVREPVLDADAPELTDEQLERAKAARFVKSVRAQTGLSQEAFATRYQINVARLRDWEQARSKPDSAARSYLESLLSNGPSDEVAVVERNSVTCLMVSGDQCSSSVFGLARSDENSATFALGWVLKESPSFRSIFVETIFDIDFDTRSCAISLQRHDEDRGFTDLEIQSASAFHVILEAKKGWTVPSSEQFGRYIPRLVESAATSKKLVSVSAAKQYFAALSLPSRLDGFEIVHFSWHELQRLATDALSNTRKLEERLWLREFVKHLNGFAAMRDVTDNSVFVVSLGAGPMPDRTQTWIEVVERDRCYFHPVGRAWPSQPPNYLGFRYSGQLQSVHHVDSFEIVRNVSSINPNWLETEIDQFVYRLGPPMKPAQVVTTGNIPRDGRVWCALDTLLSGAYLTISDARDETQRRNRPDP
jgi:DNA-binding transcriptional regulator YiaG